MSCHSVFCLLTSKMNVHFWSYLSQNISFRNFIHELDSLYKANYYCCRHYNKHSISQIYSSKHKKHFGGSYFHTKLRFYVAYFDFLENNQCLIHFNSFISIYLISKLVIELLLIIFHTLWCKYFSYAINISLNITIIINDIGTTKLAYQMKTKNKKPSYLHISNNWALS